VFALSMAARSEPAPESAVLVTLNVAAGRTDEAAKHRTIGKLRKRTSTSFVSLCEVV
jgi:hypothetical protein